MKVADFQSIIQRLQPYTKHLYFHLLGEPLLHPKLETLLQISEAAGMQVNLTTNGTLIKKREQALIVNNALRQINFSLHSFEANQLNQRITDYLTDIVAFIKMIQSKRLVYCSLRLWNMDRQQLQAKNTLNQQILTFIEQAFQLDFKLKEVLQNKQQIKLKDGIYLHLAEKFQWPALELNIISEQMFCHGLRDHLAIQVDGTVVPCCLDSEGNIPLGNIFENSLNEILNSERAKSIYDGFSKRQAVEALCKRCGYATRF